jgi:hypothetical protein
MRGAVGQLSQESIHRMYAQKAGGVRVIVKAKRASSRAKESKLWGRTYVSRFVGIEQLLGSSPIGIGIKFILLSVSVLGIKFILVRAVGGCFLVNQ